jgi:HEAT repeat protein
MKRLLAGVGIVAGVAVLAVLLDPTRALLGVLRGETFYAHRPVSYWRRELLDPAPGAQTNAIHRLASGGPGAVPVLIELLQDREGTSRADAEVRRVAAQALGHIGPQAHAAVPALTGALADPDPLVRLAAADTLGKIGPAAVDAVPALAELLKTDEPVLLLKAIRKLRGVNQAAIPALVATLAHADAEARENAAEALGEIGPAAREAAPALRALLEDPNEKVRTEAARALERIESPSGSK